MVLTRSFLNIFHPLRKSVQYYSGELLKYVPKHAPVEEHDVNQLRHFISTASSLVILTGAGISTESGINQTCYFQYNIISIGIPDYRSEEVGLYARTNHKPIQHQEFVKYPKVQQRYWARNYVGWDSFSKRTPNAVHYSIRNLEVNHKKVHLII